jgi:hypothetical protein
MKTPLKPVAAWLLLAILAAETVFLAWKASLESPFLISALLGAAVIQIRTCRSRLELAAMVPLAAGLAVLHFGPHVRPLYENPAGFGEFLGLASLFVMGVRVSRSQPLELRDNLDAFKAAVALPLFAIVSVAALPLTQRAYPVTFDRFLYAFDGSLGLQPSFVLGRLLAHLVWLRALAKLAYEQVPVAAAILYASTMGTGQRRKPNLFLVCGAAGVVGCLLYGLVPGAGPRYLFPSRFPDSAAPLAGLALLPVGLPAGIPRNAIPSLHMAWAVLMWWNARQSAILLRAGYGLILVLTVLCTLGSGEHYMIDLVVALPFALAVQAAFSVPARELPRSLPFWVGSVATLAWLGFLRFAAPVWLGAAVLGWSLVATTVAGSVVLEHRADRKYRAAENRRRAMRRNEKLETVSAPL